MPENQITEHWLLRGIQSAIFYYFSCGPCIVVETKWRRQSEARRERKQRQRALKEKMEYRKRKRAQGDTEDEGGEDGDNVIEMEVTDPNGTSRVVGVGLTGGTEENIFLPFEVNEYWGDEINPSSEEPWWWKKLTRQDPNATEPNVLGGQRGLGRKRYFRPSGDREWQEKPGKINRDDGDIWPLNESHPPVLCKGELTKEEVSWIKEPPPSPLTMRRIRGTVYEVDLDKLNHTHGYDGPVTSHPAVTKVEFGGQLMERMSSKSTKSVKSATTSPKIKTLDPEKQPTGDESVSKLSSSLSNSSERFLSLPHKTERTMTPTARPDSAVSASRLKNKPQALKGVGSPSNASSSSEDADDEDDEMELSPKTVPISKAKSTVQRSSAGKTSANSQRMENISPRASPQTIGSAVSSSDSLAGDNWLPPRMLGAKPTSNVPATPSGSTKVL